MTQYVRWTRTHPQYRQGTYIMYRTRWHATKNGVYTLCGHRIPTYDTETSIQRAAREAICGSCRRAETKLLRLYERRS